MENTTEQITSLQNLLDYDARKFTSAEVELKNALPNWINKANSIKFKNILLKYMDFIQEHLANFENVYEAENIFALAVSNKIMLAFIEETNEKLAHCTDTQIWDATLLAAIQAINHFKISAYGTAASFAKALSLEKQSAIFHEAEINEKQIDDRLSQLAEHEINISAIAPIALTR